MPKHVIEEVTKGGPAWRSGIRKGDMLCKIQNTEIKDQIDYQALSDGSNIKLEVQKPNGTQIILPIIKRHGEALGLKFGKSMELRPKNCANKCIFCFIDQMPKGLRSTLYVKDDDWRFSLMMGNYVTLTNIGDKEFNRIIARKASPLYISVHTTNPDVRSFMLGNACAGNIMERLTRLIENGIQFHTQIVACPSINDGDILKKSLEDLIALSPNVLSIAIVPIGLTRFREGLYQLRPYTAKECRNIIAMVKPYQNKCKEQLGTNLIFLADEWYVQADTEIPPHEHYEDYPQIENGVGMLRLLENQMKIIAIAENTICQDNNMVLSQTLKPQSILIATGFAAYKFLKSIVNTYKPATTNVDVVKIINYEFGQTVTVAALITAKDLYSQLCDLELSQYDEIWITESMLRVQGSVFLDGTSLEELQAKLPIKLRTIGTHGTNLYDALWQI